MINHCFSAFLIVRFNYSTARSLAGFFFFFFAAFISFLEIQVKQPVSDGKIKKSNTAPVSQHEQMPNINRNEKKTILNCESFSPPFRNGCLRTDHNLQVMTACNLFHWDVLIQWHNNILSCSFFVFLLATLQFHYSLQGPSWHVSALC